MDRFYCLPDEDTPEMELNPETKTLFIKGISMPEDAKVFYEPLMSYLESYIDTLEGEIMTFRVEFSYFNSASAKIIHEILEILPINSLVLWCCDQEDDDMIDAGNEFIAILDNQIDFKIVEI